MSLLIKYEIEPVSSTAVRIRLGEGKYAIVDRADWDYLKKYRWFAMRTGSCWYAARRVRICGKVHVVYMHREITGCPPGLHVHHHNHNTFDNRNLNLCPMSPGTHARMPKAG